MFKKEKLITLKEASQISGYSSDYIGQLIRAGKISGKQVYCNIAWMTTSDAVLDYKKQNEANNSKENKNSANSMSGAQKLRIRFNLFKLFLANFRLASPLILVIVAMILILNIYLFFYLTNNAKQPVHATEKAQAEALTY